MFVVIQNWIKLKTKTRADHRKKLWTTLVFMYYTNITTVDTIVLYMLRDERRTK